MSVASGTRSLLGLALEKQVPGSQIGAPFPIITATAAPAAPTHAAGAVGLVTGTVLYKQSFLVAGRGETLPSVASGSSAYSLKHVTVTIANGADAKVAYLGKRIYRSSDAGVTYKDVGTVWDNTTTTFDDNTAVGSEGTRVPRTADQTAANYGFKFIRPDNGTSFDRNDSYIMSTEQTGKLGEARGIPGMVKEVHTLNCPARTGIAALLFGSMLGKPTVTQTAAEPTLTYAYTPSDLTTDSVSLAALWHKGGDLKPMLFGGIKCGDIEFTMSGKKELDIKAKLLGTWDAEMGFAKADGANTGTFQFVPVARGPRMDLPLNNANSIYVKLTSTPAVLSGTLGSFTIKASVFAANTAIASVTFGSTTSTVYYDTVTKRQCHPSAIGSTTTSVNQGAWVEIYDQNGIAIGADAGENRRPVEVYFPDDVTLLLSGDGFEIRQLQKIPGIYSAANPTGPASDGTWTGQAPRFVLTPRFTPAHVIINRGATSGTVNILSCQAGALKLQRPMDPVEALGPDAANPIDVDVFGRFKLELDIDRRFDSREFERLGKQDGRLYVTVVFQGERIVIDPVASTLSASREKISFTFNQVRLMDTASPLTGDKVYVEKIKFAVEQPDDDTLDVFTLTIVSPDSYDFARI